MNDYRFCHPVGGTQLRPDHIRDVTVEPKRSLCGQLLTAVVDEPEPVTPDTVRRQLGERYTNGVWVLCEDCGDVHKLLQAAS